MAIRVVLDTNVIISGALFGGLPREVLQTAIDHRISVFIGDDIIEEISGVLQRPKFRKTVLLNAILIGQIVEVANKVRTFRKEKVILNDRNDPIIIDCAIAAEAEYIVTGDLEFIAYGEVAGIPIIQPRQLLEILSRRSFQKAMRI